MYTMKKCNFCGIEKDDSEFTKRYEGGLLSWCKKCRSLWYKLSKEEKEKIKAERKQEREKIQKEKKKKIEKEKNERKEKKKKEKLERKFKICPKCKIKKPISEFWKSQRGKCKKCCGWKGRTNQKLADEEKRIRHNKQMLDYYYRNRVARNFGNRMRDALNRTGVRKTKKWEELVGYTVEDLKKYLESQFQPGMTWDNYGKNGWNIDHIQPIHTFNIKKENDEEFQECWSLENLRPLWQEENMKRKKERRTIEVSFENHAKLKELARINKCSIGEIIGELLKIKEGKTEDEDYDEMILTI